MLNENNNNNRFIFYFCFWDKSRRRFWGNLGDCLLLGTSFVYRDISFFRSNRPTSEGRVLPVRARLLRVTQKVSSNSIHTLLCSDEHKNPTEVGLRKNGFRPLHEAVRYALSFGCKAEIPRLLFRVLKRQLPVKTMQAIF